MTGTEPRILIAGAGPVGLTAAVELARRGHALRIIDKSGGPVPESRALGVNPRSLEILEPCGATEEMIARGIRLRRFNFWDPPQLIFTVPISELQHRYNFILALPQQETERILLERLRHLGSDVEWQTELVFLEQADGACACGITTGPGAEEARFDIVIGADGAHSTVRKALGIGFHGNRYANAFGLADVMLTGPVEPNEANVFRVEGGIVAVFPMGGGRFRIVADRPDVLEALPEDFEVGEIFWQSSFRISRRQVEIYQKGNVFLAGDAAHIHSPVGGRGMNLGIEDAATLAWLIETGRTEEYSGRRWPVGRHVLRQPHAQTSFVTSMNPVIRFFRRNIVPVLLSSRWVRARQLPEMAGLTAPAPPWLDGASYCDRARISGRRPR